MVLAWFIRSLSWIWAFWFLVFYNYTTILEYHSPIQKRTWAAWGNGGSLGWKKPDEPGIVPSKNQSGGERMKRLVKRT